MKTLNLKDIIDETLRDEAKKLIKEQLTLAGESEGGKDMYHITHNGEPVDTFEDVDIAKSELQTYKNGHPDKEFEIKKVKYGSPTELIDKLDEMGEQLEEDKGVEIKENKQMIKKVKSLAEAIKDAKKRGVNECTINGKKYNVAESLKLLEQEEKFSSEETTGEVDELHLPAFLKNKKKDKDEDKDDKEEKNELPDALKYLGKKGDKKEEKEPCNECGKSITETKKKTLRLSESELIALISRMVTESMGEPFEKKASVPQEIKKSGGNKGVIDPKGKVPEKEPFKGKNTGTGAVVDPFEKKASVKQEIKKASGGKEVIDPKGKVAEKEPFKGANTGSGNPVDPFEKTPSVKQEIKKVGGGKEVINPKGKVGEAAPFEKKASVKGEIKTESIPGLEVTKRARKVSGDESKTHMGDVESKMKKASSFEGNDKPEFPKPIGKGEKMAINPTDDQAQYITDNRGGGLQDLQYDHEPSDKFKERLKMAIEGDTKMGNGHDAANVIKTNVGSNVVKSAEKKKENLKKEKLVGWGHRSVQPTDVKTVSESIPEKSALLEEEMKRMKDILGYNKKTQ